MLFSFIKLNHQTTTNRWWSLDFKHGIVRFTINQSFSLGVCVCVCKCEFLFHLLLLQRIYSSFIRFYPFIHRLMKHSRVSLFFFTQARNFFFKFIYWKPENWIHTYSNHIRLFSIIWLLWRSRKFCIKITLFFTHLNRQRLLR